MTDVPVSPVRSKVFGVGWAKTGTTSLGSALQILGYKHKSIRLDLVLKLRDGDLEALTRVTDANESFDDWPWSLVYKEMATRYPDAKFVLTVRDPEKLVRSYRKMIGREFRRAPNIDAIRTFIYGCHPEYADDATLCARITEHNEAVRTFFSTAPERLLEVDWTKGDGWKELSAFLGHAVPDIPFPHSNAAPKEETLKSTLKQYYIEARRRVRGLWI